MTIAAIRFNNPGNVSLPIQGWSGGGTIVGLRGQPGYASFPDVATGLAAFQQRLNNYIDVKGYNTISSLNSVYAQDQNWKYGVSQASGIGVNTPLDTNNPQQMGALQYGIVQQETGNASQFGLSSGGNTDPNSVNSYAVAQGYGPGGPNDPDAPNPNSNNPDEINAYAASQGYGPGGPNNPDAVDYAAVNPDNPDQVNAYATAEGYGPGGAYNPDATASDVPIPEPPPGGSYAVNTPQDSVPSSDVAMADSTNPGAASGGLPGPIGAMMGGGQSGGGGGIMGALGGIAGQAGQLFGMGSANAATITDFSSQGGSQGGGDGGGGAPIRIVNASEVGTKAGGEVQKGAGELGKNIGETGKALDQTINASVETTTKTGTGWLQYLANFVSDILPRGIMAAIAFILILMGLWFMGIQGEKK